MKSGTRILVTREIERILNFIASLLNDASGDTRAEAKSAL